MLMGYFIPVGQYTVIATAGIVALFKIWTKVDKWRFSRQASKPARSK